MRSRSNFTTWCREIQKQAAAESAVYNFRRSVIVIGGREYGTWPPLNSPVTKKKVIVGRIQAYFREELNQELGFFDAEFLVDFFAEEMGAYFYNRALYDAQAILQRRLEDFGEAVFELEKPTDFRR